MIGDQHLSVIESNQPRNEQSLITAPCHYNFSGEIGMGCFGSIDCDDVSGIWHGQPNCPSQIFGARLGGNVSRAGHPDPIALATRREGDQARWQRDWQSHSGSKWSVPLSFHDVGLWIGVDNMLAPFRETVKI
jgi:hypothetical protein